MVQGPIKLHNAIEDILCQRFERPGTEQLIDCLAAAKPQAAPGNGLQASFCFPVHAAPCEPPSLLDGPGLVLAGPRHGAWGSELGIQCTVHAILKEASICFR